jgi:hypothetical protein
MVRIGKLRSAGGTPAEHDHYQLLPAAWIKYTHMKTVFKTLAVAIAMVTVCLVIHYAIGTFSY